jgi:thiosulfate/3-mercaptopyruvate sulfurtransferase
MSAYPALIDADALAASLDDPRLRVLDATVILHRPPGGGPYTPESGRAGYEAEHIPGAAFADVLVELADPDARYPFWLPAPERFAAGVGALGVGAGTHVVTYAQETPMWATRLWWLLRYFGFDDVSVLDGGLPAWKAAGHPVTDAPSSYPPATFTPRVRPERLATRADVEAVVGGTPACLVNALPAPTFRGEGKTSYSRPGRIPGSVSAPSADLLDPDTLRFRPAEVLERELDSIGARGEDAVIVYCGGGISATVDVFALSLVGRDDVRMYDGSLTEWSADPDLPLEVG